MAIGQLIWTDNNRGTVALNSAKEVFHLFPFIIFLQNIDDPAEIYAVSLLSVCILHLHPALILTKYIALKVLIVLEVILKPVHSTNIHQL